MFKHKLLERKDCPFCEKIIYVFDKKGRAVCFNGEGITFWIGFQDGSNAEVACCKDCVNSITQEKMDKFMQDQRYTWGYEIVANPLSLVEFYKQLNWYINTAVHLKIVKHAKTKEELG
jgi:hypothetical protein